MSETILATFKDGRTAPFTTSVLRLMLTDPDVIKIVKEETGEILKQEGGKNA
jgi:hypothetical protein